MPVIGVVYISRSVPTAGFAETSKPTFLEFQINTMLFNFEYTRSSKLSTNLSA